MTTVATISAPHKKRESRRRGGCCFAERDRCCVSVDVIRVVSKHGADDIVLVKQAKETI